MRIELHIERLVLEGLPLEARQRPRLQAAVERELALLLANGDALAHSVAGGAIASLSGGAFQLSPAADATGLGRQIATVVYGGLRGGR